MIMTVNAEYFEHVLTDWAENLWLLNHQDRCVDKESKEEVIKEFHRNFYPATRGLSKAQNLSERNFMRFCWGLTYLEAVVPVPVIEKISQTKLVDHWRRSVFRNSFQQRYTAFEKILKETVDRFGVQAAVAQCPVNLARGFDLVEAFQGMNYQSTFLPPKAVENVMQQVDNRSSKPPTKRSPGPQ